MAHILIIDDDTPVRQTVRMALEALGHQVSEAQDGRRGLAAHQDVPADLIITDLVMPDMEGIETIVELMRLSPAIRIIAMSGGGLYNRDYLLMAKKLGARLTLPKPFTIEQLTALVARALTDGQTA